MALQETLTDELVGMAAAMRSSTAALEGRLAERGALLEDADDALQRSLDSTRRSRTRARRIVTRYGSGFKRSKGLAAAAPAPVRARSSLGTDHH